MLPSLVTTHGIRIYNSTFNTGDGNDTIEGSGIKGISNEGLIDTGNGKDIITGNGKSYEGGGIFNFSTIDTGDDDDSIIASIIVEVGFPNRALENFGSIETGNGDDIITSTGVIYNEGVINTGNGKDSIIADGGFDGSGNVFLGNGKDELKGFGSGEFSGGNGNDTLELTSGTYTVGRWYTAVTFTKGSSIMIASEFEKLIAGSTTYDFASLTKGQTITIA
jgi:hypothetical protein